VGKRVALTIQNNAIWGEELAAHFVQMRKGPLTVQSLYARKRKIGKVVEEGKTAGEEWGAP